MFYCYIWHNWLLKLIGGRITVYLFLYISGFIVDLLLNNGILSSVETVGSIISSSSSIKSQSNFPLKCLSSVSLSFSLDPKYGRPSSISSSKFNSLWLTLDCNLGYLILLDDFTIGYKGRFLSVLKFDKFRLIFGIIGRTVSSGDPNSLLFLLIYGRWLIGDSLTLYFGRMGTSDFDLSILFIFIF